MKKPLPTFVLLFATAVSGAAAAPAWPPKDDATARTWLSVDKFAHASLAADGFLKSLNGRLRVLGCGYEGNQLLASRPFADGKLSTGDAEWTCDTRFAPSASDSADLTLAFKVASGAVKSAGVAVAFDFDDWSTDNYILVPAQIYGGNRFHILPLHYPPYIHNEKDHPSGMPATTTDILHLNKDGSAAKIEMNTGNVSTPMLSFWNPKEKRGFILLAEQNTRFGNNGLFIQEDAGPGTEKKRISFIVSAPGVREQRYVMGGRAGSGDHAADWKAGDELTLKFKVHNFDCANMEAFYAKVFDVRKALTGENTYACVTPYSEAARLLTEHHDAHKWFESETFSTYTNNASSQFGMQIGWSGVPIHGFPNLIAETPQRITRVCLSMETMLLKSQGKTGLYYAMNHKGNKVGDTFEGGGHPAIAMVRRSGETLYFGLQSLALLKQRGHADRINPNLEKSLHACAEGLVNVWNTYGQFGQFMDVETGRMVIDGSTAGSGIGAALGLASRYFHEPKYLEVAEASMKMYFDRDLSKGYCGGGPGEILQAPDSESTANMVESCIALYELTGKREWLDRAKFAADMLSTWMVSYDYRFPEGSEMNRAGTHAAGSIFASSQNNHSAPGYYILSGDCLLKLFRATGDKRYARMYKDTSHNVVQYVGAPHNPLRKENGHVTERVQLSDWEGGNIGSVNHGDSNMAWETLAALTCLENPGIYLRTDDDTLVVMDHVEAQVEKRDASGVTLKITNPTKYDASVSVLAESAAQAKKSLGWGAYDQWPKFAVKAGETATVVVKGTAFSQK